MPKIRIATVFSGIGAAEWALKRLGWEHEIVFACDSDKYVKTSYLANYGLDESLWFENARSLDGKAFHGKVDLLVGGSPCQSFSFAGKMAGLNDTRGTLFYEYARLIKEISPRYFIYENVEGLLCHDSGKTWKIMREVFNDIGYHFHEALLNAKDYGMPQSRERLFVVGTREKVPFTFPDSFPLQWKAHVFHQDIQNISQYWIPSLFSTNHPTPEDLQALDPFRVEQYDPDDSYFDKYVLSEKSTKYVLNVGTKGFCSRPRVDFNVARTLLATMHKMHRSGVDNYIRCRGERHKGKIRKLTPRECLRYMGFDDSFKIVVSNLQIFRQTGNSIVVNVLMELFKEIFKNG